LGKLCARCGTSMPGAAGAIIAATSTSGGSDTWSIVGVNAANIGAFIAGSPLAARPHRPRCDTGLRARAGLWFKTLILWTFHPSGHRMAQEVFVLGDFRLDPMRRLLLRYQQP